MSPVPTQREVVASQGDWLGLLDSVARGDVRVVLSGRSGQRAVMLSEAELERLEAQAARSRSLQLVLTPREREVLLLVEQGRTTAEAAGALGVAPGTVVQHLAAARRKYGVRSSSEAAALARLSAHLD